MRGHHSGQITSTEFYNIPPAVFWNSVRTWLQPDDLPFMLIKALVFGLQIAVLACGWGLTTGGPKEVGTSTTGSVVMILVTVALMMCCSPRSCLADPLMPQMTPPKKGAVSISPSLRLPLLIWCWAWRCCPCPSIPGRP